jgi:hypothetical protein
LQSVIGFLKNFQVYPKVVIHCARKTDASMWDVLFECAGSASELFELCLKRNFIHSAASGLRIVQLLHGTEEARMSAHRLLEHVLRSDSLELLSDLLKFLDPVRLFDITSNEIEKSEEFIEEENSVQELILSRYVRRVLRQYNLKLLLDFTLKTSRDISFWLFRERKRAAVLEEFLAPLNATHEHFSIPFPTAVPPASEWGAKSSLHVAQKKKSSVPSSPVVAFYPQEAPDSPRNQPLKQPSLTTTIERKITPVSVVSPSGSSPRTLKNSTGVTFVEAQDTSPSNLIPQATWEKLELLLFEFYHCKAYGWAIVLGCITMNIPILLHLLEQNPDSWPLLRDTLVNHKL